MNTEPAIYGILAADATLIAALALPTSIYPEVAPQGADNPCIVFSETTPEYSDNKDGVSHLDTNMWQVDIYASTVAQRNTIGARVRTLLDRYSGTINGVMIQSVRLVYQYKTLEFITDDQAKKVYRQTFDFMARQRI